MHDILEYTILVRVVRFFSFIECYQCFQHDFIRGSRSQDRKIRIEIKDFIDRARRRRGMIDMEEEFGDGDEYDLAAVIQEEEKGDTLCEAPGATLRRNLTMMQGGEPSPVGT